jgi:hypothetical protein
MTTRPSPDELLATYLMEGMDVLPDRVADAVLDEVHRTRQRTVFGPRRTPVMLRNILAVAAVIVVLVIGGATLLGAFRPNASVGAPSPSPTSEASPTTTPTGATLPPFPSEDSPLSSGPYATVRFSQPMTMTLPDVEAEFGPSEQVSGFTYGNGHTIQIIYANVNAAITVHDDFTVNTSLCAPTDEVQEVPATPAAVGEWLHGLADGPFVDSMTVTDAPDVVVDGRPAKVYDVVMGPQCGTDQDPVPGRPDIWFGAHERHRIYAIPTGTDTILAITWPNDGPSEPVNAVADRLVASLEFD